MDARPMILPDRKHAGRLLAARLTHLRGEDVVVLGLVRGGIAVAAEVARELDAPLDVIVARKLGAPLQRELAIGAVARDAYSINEDIVGQLAISERELMEIAAAAMSEVRRYEEIFRGGRPPEPVAGRTAIIVDDGLATGATAMAAIRGLRRQKPKRIVLAVPVCAPASARQIEPEVDELVCLARPAGFFAVGQFYEDFEQVEDEEVEQVLREAHLRASSRAAAR
jgi:putative phosphoribosyl transferase